MWKTCPLRINDPIYLIWGLQMSDLVVGAIFLIVMLYARQSLVGLLVLPVLLYYLRKLRKDKAPGYVPRLLHWLGLWSIPGCLPPQPYTYRIQ